MSKPDKYKRKAIFAELKPYCVFAKPDDYIEITMWKNGDGFDVDINGRKSERFSLTWGEFKAIKKLIKKIDK